jgi:hypothetical protein
MKQRSFLSKATLLQMSEVAKLPHKQEVRSIPITIFVHIKKAIHIPILYIQYLGLPGEEAFVVLWSLGERGN